ncbi:hypothetical protein Q2490_07870 [Myroides odoratimimus]|nr:hypothetical protein [Myroides odoratimimus]MDO5857201.1 hypothetical protein [Myroides odoratimimus]
MRTKLFSLFAMCLMEGQIANAQVNDNLKSEHPIPSTEYGNVSHGVYI